MNLINHLDKNNLHHAYLLEGAREDIVPELLKFMESLGMQTSGNPDFCHISVDSFKIEDARNLKSVEYEKSFSQTKDARKIFMISANNFLLEAQNTLLKIFEEPIENTHFFLIVPDKNILLKTLVSRFYLITSDKNKGAELKTAEEFIKMSLKNRIDFIKELLAEEDEDEENPVIETVSTRSKALKFLNAVESVLQHRGTLCNYTGFPCAIFQQIFKVREFLSQPGSSVKSLMESVALSIPYLK